VNAYVDSSVVLRVLLGQRNRLTEWKRIRGMVGSALVELECLRTLDRLRLLQTFSDKELVARREAVFRLLAEFRIVELGRPVLSRAAQPFPLQLGTLDAIHLATALLVRDAGASDLVMATHDGALADAARASGLPVVGSSG